MRHEPGPRGRPRWLALAVSAAVHSLLFLVVIHGRLPPGPGLAPRLISLPEIGPDDERTAPVRYYIPLIRQGAGVRPVPQPPVVPLPIDTAAPVALAEPETAVDTVKVPRVAPQLVPGPGDGRLWVRPLPLPPRELAKRLEPSHIELVDSAVTAIVQAYLDSIAHEPGADQVELPDWTTTVDGSKFGLDSRNIYIAGLKIPAAVLALLPLPASGNQQQALDHSGAWIAEDLRRAGQRAASLEDFKRAVRELRKEKQRQRNLEQAQREKPDSTKP